MSFGSLINVPKLTIAGELYVVSAHVQRKRRSDAMRWSKLIGA